MGGGVDVEEQIISTSDIDKARKQLRNKEFHSETDPSEAGEGSDQGSIRVVPHRLPHLLDYKSTGGYLVNYPRSRQ
jgi:hypothetical protein